MAAAIAVHETSRQLRLAALRIPCILAMCLVCDSLPCLYTHNVIRRSRAAAPQAGMLASMPRRRAAAGVDSAMLGAELLLWAGAGALALLERHLAERTRRNRLAEAQRAWEEEAAEAAAQQKQEQQQALPGGYSA